MTPRNHSPDFFQTVSRWSILAIALSVFVCGLVWRNANLFGVGAAILCFILRRAWDGASNDTRGRLQNDSRKRESDRGARSAHHAQDQRSAETDPNPVEELSQRDCPPKSTDALVEELLASGRYALMLRPETK